MPVAQASASDSLIEGAKLCTKHLPRYEREYGIPTHLLAAIATTESGRYHKGLKISIPWPWTINAQGKGYYYGSKAEAVAAAKRFRAQGIKSFDVGCMQVNMHHHGAAFSSLEQALEPQNNIAYAASFLRTLYQEGKSWKKAAGDYHSKTPSRGRNYVGNVYNRWFEIASKLRAAKIQAGTAPAASTTTLAMKEEKPVARKATPLPEQRGKQVAANKTPRMKVITLSKKSGKDNIIVVRPDIKVVDTKNTVTYAKVKPVALTVVEPVRTAAPAKQVAAAARSTATKSGPNFVFND